MIYMELSNPHNIVLNQTLNFSQSTLSNSSMVRVSEVSPHMAQHWERVAEHFREFVEGLKMFELLDISSDADMKIKERISQLLDTCQAIDNNELKQVSEMMNGQNINEEDYELQDSLSHSGIPGDEPW